MNRAAVLIVAVSVCGPFFYGAYKLNQLNCSNEARLDNLTRKTVDLVDDFGRLLDRRGESLKEFSRLIDRNGDLVDGNGELINKMKEILERRGAMTSHEDFPFPLGGVSPERKTIRGFGTWPDPHFPGDGFWLETRDRTKAEQQADNQHFLDLLKLMPRTKGWSQQGIWGSTIFGAPRDDEKDLTPPPPTNTRYAVLWH